MLSNSVRAACSTPVTMLILPDGTTIAIASVIGTNSTKHSTTAMTLARGIVRPGRSMSPAWIAEISMPENISSAPERNARSLPCRCGISEPAFVDIAIGCPAAIQCTASTQMINAGSTTPQATANQVSTLATRSPRSARKAATQVTTTTIARTKAAVVLQARVDDERGLQA